MLIAQYKSTNIAHAPDELCKAINKYSSHQSVMVGFNGMSAPPRNTNILHCHNKVMGIQHRARKKTLVQYHSEPFQVDLKTPVDSRLVIAQYHATLPQYKNFKIVRNVIDFNTPQYSPVIIDDKIKIGFSPSRKKKMGAWHDKGYDKTIQILNRIKNRFPNVEVDIIHGVPLDECIRRKSQCNILIDECVTKSYHRSGLEGLALGKLTICSMDKQVERIMKKAAGSSTQPFVNIWIDSLEKKLSALIESNDMEYILKKGEASREWMEKYWSPQVIVNDFIKIYKKALG